jgi:hypothetical protein
MITSAAAATIAAYAVPSKIMIAYFACAYAV